MRPEIRLYTAAVLRQSRPRSRCSPCPWVRFSWRPMQMCASRCAWTRTCTSRAAPVFRSGLYVTGGTESPVYLDADFLLGPEAAHLNITGVSGLATKTSAVSSCSLRSSSIPRAKGLGRGGLLQREGPRPVFLDQPGELDDADRRMYEQLGVPASRSRNVHYYAPYKADGYNLNTLRTHAALAETSSRWSGDCEEVLEFAEVLLNRDDVDAKADALIDFIAERMRGQRFRPTSCGPRPPGAARSPTWMRGSGRSSTYCEQNDQRRIWRTHHVATIRKVRNRLLNISTRAKGLVTDDGPSSDLPWGAFQDRTVYVIDVANVEPQAQDLVFARVVSKLREHLERRDLGVDHLVVFVDELNKYAPAMGRTPTCAKMLLDIAERGRYLGLVLFGAQQFRSQVHRRVVGNAGTALYGRMDVDELATPGYAVSAPAIKIKLATLDEG